MNKVKLILNGCTENYITNKIHAYKYLKKNEK